MLNVDIWLLSIPIIGLLPVPSKRTGKKRSVNWRRQRPSLRFVNSSGRERLVTATKVESAARLTTVPWSRHNDAERGGDAISCRRWPYAVSAGVQLKMCKKPPAIGAPTGWLTQSVPTKIERIAVSHRPAWSAGTATTPHKDRHPGRFQLFCTTEIALCAGQAQWQST